MISVLILTFNEEQNLPQCLRSVTWSDDVLVLDSFSSDRTVEIARAAGVRVVQRKFDDFAGQRNFGLQQGDLRHDWILHLDADEVVTPALHVELLRVVERREKLAYRVASRVMFRGRWLRYAALYPSYQVRFGRKGHLAFVQCGHGQRETISPEETGTLAEPLLHYPYSKGLDEWFARHNYYSAAEAREALRAHKDQPMDWKGLIYRDPMRRRRALKRLAARLPFRPTLRFIYMYVVRAGWRDGAAGLTYCRMLALYERMIVLKLQELRRGSSGLPL